MSYMGLLFFHWVDNWCGSWYNICKDGEIWRVLKDSSGSEPVVAEVHLHTTATNANATGIARATVRSSKGASNETRLYLHTKV